MVGAGQYSMRVWLDPPHAVPRPHPARCHQHHPAQIQEVAAGQIGAPPAVKGQDFQYTLNLNGRLSEAPDFENLIVKVEPGAGVELHMRSATSAASSSGPRPTANSSISTAGRRLASPSPSCPRPTRWTVSTAVYNKMEELKKSFPEGLEYIVPYDTTKFVKAAIREVWRTLIEAGILVLIVILVFLQDWRAMLVPATTVPVTIIGAFAAMAALGFSINLPTLFAIILVIGIVVDDAIVIVGGVSRYVEQGMPGREAAGKAMDELTGPVIGITLVLDAWVHPSGVPAGPDGTALPPVRVVIAATAFISAINAMTLEADPMRPLAKAPCAPREAEHLLLRLQLGLFRGGARLRPADVGHDRARPAHGLPGARPRCLRDLVADPRADRIPADRGSGLHDRCGAIAGRGIERAHRRGAGEDPRRRGESPRRRTCRDGERHLDPRQSAPASPTPA